MPNMNGTGPRGTGPIGRRKGPCFREASFSKNDEIKILREQKEQIEKRLKELENA